MKKKVININCTRSITISTFFIPLIRKLLLKNYEVNVICSNSNELKIFFLEFKNINFYQINFPTTLIQLFNPIFLINFIIRYYLVIKKLKNYCFYTHTPVASNFLRLIAFFFFKIKIIYHVHGFRFHSDANIFNNIFFKICERILSLKTNFYILINNEDYTYVKNKLNSPSVLIKGVGADTDKINNQIKLNNLNKKLHSENKITIGVIGAYKKNKGWIDIINLLDLLKNNNIIIKCYGYGDFTNYKLRSNKISSKIIFNPFINNIYQEMISFDMLIQPSYREGLPVVIMEAMYLGIPIIASDIRGNRDLITNNVNGYLYKSGNILELYSHVFKIIQNPQLVDRFNKYNIKMINESLNRNNKTNEIYEELDEII